MKLATRLEELLRQEFGHEQLLADAAATDSPPAGAWRAGDHLAHFSLWRSLFLDHARLVLSGVNSQTPPDDLDAVNERQLAADRGLPVEELVQRWGHTSHEMLAFVGECSQADLQHQPEWYGASTIGGAIVRNSYTHPCGHLVDFHFERGRLGQAADLADDMSGVVAELVDLDPRFPAATHTFRGFALTLRDRPDEAMEAFARAVALRPVIGPMLRDEAILARLRGRSDFAALTARPTPAGA